MAAALTLLLVPLSVQRASAADDQLIESAMVAVLALLIGLPMMAARGRQDDTPLSPGAAPSLSNSGNSGSTVWK